MAFRALPLNHTQSITGAEDVTVTLVSSSLTALVTITHSPALRNKVALVGTPVFPSTVPSGLKLVRVQSSSTTGMTLVFECTTTPTDGTVTCQVGMTKEFV